MNQTTVPMREQESKYITKLARKQLSRIGFVYLAGTVLLLALELSLVRLFQFGNPAGGYDSSVLTFCNLFLRFVLGYPLMLCLIHLVKKGKPIPEKKMKAGSIFTAFFMSYAMAMIANIIGLLLTSIINAFHEGVNITDLQETMLALPSVWLILFVCVGAPVFEDLPESTDRPCHLLWRGHCHCHVRSDVRTVPRKFESVCLCGSTGGVLCFYLCTYRKNQVYHDFACNGK